ncbi:MAG: hypothetical protein PHF46_04130 [Candidatus Gracilibacteria bacterium]|nr:hypothetical protein [Candidatus Gracilibacteria bacterium]MDD3120571.1 hypothetical protein [Candidatus Gracilibacteria bacterium]MDD4530374.1 hypothetical protein [Candidatus Gracilibacteria bacterium]
MAVEILFESDIRTKIYNSIVLTEEEKEKFLKFLSYFTLEEIEDLKTLI